MSDTIANSDRALIDKAIAAGRVSTMPACTFSPQEAPASSVSFLFGGKLGHKKRTPPAIAKRRMRVREMTEAGRSCAEMAEALHISVKIVWDDRKALREQGKIA